jgi:hypothetical protein
MLNVDSNRARSLSDLAASLTDPALELLKSVGARGDSVETELELWRALTAELQRESRERRYAPLDGALNRVLNRAALRVIAKRPLSSRSRTLRAERAIGCLTCA